MDITNDMGSVSLPTLSYKQAKCINIRRPRSASTSKQPDEALPISIYILVQRSGYRGTRAK